MVFNEIIKRPLISLGGLNSKTTNEFLDHFKDVTIANISKGITLNIHKKSQSHPKKIFPNIIPATPEDAKTITEIYLDAFDGSYPFKEMEDEQAVRKMIDSDNYQWFIFRDHHDEVAGCFTYHLNFPEKKGYMRGFILKKKYFGKIDVVKTTIACMIAIWTLYRNRIYVWYAENRTAHAKAQHMAVVCGIRPIAFFPNKDVFLNKVESDIMHIIYDEKALYKYRRKDVPVIIPKAARGFYYANERYNLGEVILEIPIFSLDHIKLTILKKTIITRIEKDRFGYEKITFSYRNSDAYFTFLYTPQVQNFEKTEYYVNNSEELFVFLQELKNFIRRYNIRYCECFVSAYLPEHQKIFYDTGFFPRGYVPSWKYNPSLNKFEDHIVFNYYEGALDENMKLVEESESLLFILGEL